MSRGSSSGRRGHYVCARLGRVNSEEWQALKREHPGVCLLMKAGCAEIWGLGHIDKRGAAEIHWGGLVEPEGHPSQELAFEERVCAGAYRDEDRLVLYSDPFGLQPLYRRSSGAGYLVSTLIDPLVRCSERKLSLDWEAWSTLLTLGAPLDEKTPFAEVRRWTAGEYLAVTADGTIQASRREPSWLGTPPGELPTEELRCILSDSLPPVLPWRKPPAITLSGGWDSRLLAMLAKRKYVRRQRAWTTAVDDGREFDLDFAPQVARRLRLEHRILLPKKGSYPRYARETRQRVEFQTPLHVWLAPLAKAIRKTERHLLDGLAGGVLLQGNFVFRNILEAGDRGAQFGALFQRLGGRGPRNFAESSVSWSRVRDSAETQFRAEAERFRGHHNELMLTVMVTRIARVVAPSPMALFYPETKVSVPYLAPRAMAAAVAIPPTKKLDGGVFRGLLEATDPGIAGLPSTNDPLPPRKYGRREHRTRKVTAWMSTSIGQDPVTRQLCPRELLDKLEQAQQGGTPSWQRPEYRALLVLSLLAEWRKTYASELSNYDELP